MLLGSLNHVSITVSDLDEAMGFFRPVLRLLGFSVAEPIRDPSSGSRLTVNLNPNGLALNVWEASPALAGERFEVYAPGLHHIAFNVARHAEIDALHALLMELGAEILDGPAEFPYAEDGQGYYAIYFRGPDGLKLEAVHMPGLEALYRTRGLI